MKDINIRLIKQCITSLVVFAFLTYILIKTKDLLTRIIVIPFIVFSLSFFIEKILIIFNKKTLAKKINKICVIAFLVYFFCFIIMWCYTSIKDGAYLQTLFSLPFWIVGIYIGKRKLFNKKEKINTEKTKTKTKLNIDFRILISAFLVIIVLLSGISMLFFGIKDTYKLN